MPRVPFLGAQLGHCVAPCGVGVVTRATMVTYFGRTCYIGLVLGGGCRSAPKFCLVHRVGDLTKAQNYRHNKGTELQTLCGSMVNLNSRPWPPISQVLFPYCRDHSCISSAAQAPRISWSELGIGCPAWGESSQSWIIEYRQPDFLELTSYC